MFKVRSVGSGDLTEYYSDTNVDYSIVRIKSEIDNIPIIKPRYKIYVLNPDETVSFEIPEEDIISGGSYNENYQSGQRRTLSFSLFNYLKKYTPSINTLWCGTKLKLEIGMEIGNDTLWFPKGVFVINSINSTHENGTNIVSIESSDKFSILESADGILEMSYTIEVGEIIENVVKDLLLLQHGNGNPLDPILPIYNSVFKGAVVQAEINKQAGDTIGSIILELATQLSAEVFYDIEGHLNFVPINSVTDDEDKPIIYHFSEILGGLTSNNLSLDFSGVVNRVIVIGNTSNNEVIQAVAVNDNTASPLCYQRIGYKTGAPINDNNITSQMLAQERADYELRQKLILKTTSSCTVRYNPLLSVNNLVSLSDDFFNMTQEKFLIQSVSFTMDYSGVCSISISNINNLQFTTGRK